MQDLWNRFDGFYGFNKLSFHLLKFSTLWPNKARQLLLNRVHFLRWLLSPMRNKCSENRKPCQAPPVRSSRLDR